MTKTKLFVEKYRPRKLEDFIGNKEIVDIMKIFIKEKHIPHLIFCGPTSVGKTSLVRILASSLFDTSMLKERVLELNSSEDRGIRVIRNRVKKYVLSSIDLSLPNCAKFKMIILDDADTLSMDSQYALRRILEDSSKSTRFVIICNDTNSIIPPILSRCMVLNFKTIHNRDIKDRLNFICENENISKEYIESCLQHCNNDLRISISTLQNNLALENNKPIYWKNNLNSKFTINLLNDGYEPILILKSLVRFVLDESNSLPHELEEIMSLIADTCGRLSCGCSPIIQILNIVLLINIKVKNK